ncbi:MAG: hypothetical protein LBQ88_21530 [Treponema sp.]|jgi:hypothetical protein|nr:hypothetical protein [Treponema sp.]
MKRLEIIANQSVQENILQRLETHIEGFSYTLIPVVHGKGKNCARLGTAIWPEENCMIISYLPDQMADLAASLVEAVKRLFPQEGIKLFVIETNQNSE